MIKYGAEVISSTVTVAVVEDTDPAAFLLFLVAIGDVGGCIVECVDGLTAWACLFASTSCLRPSMLFPSNFCA